MGGEYYVDENKLSNDEKKTMKVTAKMTNWYSIQVTLKKWHRVLLI